MKKQSSKKIEKSMEFKKYYLSEFQLHDGEVFITFNIVAINTDTRKAQEDEKARHELYDKFKLIAEKYTPLQQNGKGVFLCIIAKSPQDLINEGEALHHCVGRMNYDQKVIREETLIFFIRSKDNPNTPLVTIEYSLKARKILQCYAEHNQKPSEDIENYVYKKWLPYANRQLKKIA